MPYKFNLIKISLFLFMSALTLRLLANTAKVSSPFVTLMTTPTVDPYFREQLGSSQSLKIHDSELDKKVKNLVTKSLQDFITCFGEGRRTSLIILINQWIEDINKIKVYKTSGINSTAQGRFGASNSAQQEILINASYPQTNNIEVETVFYLHESLSALGINDRWYAITSSLWALNKLCQESHELFDSHHDMPSLKFEYQNYLLTIINTIRYDTQKMPASPYQNDYFADASGGVTGVGSGGDPIVAYFQASLYKEALLRDLSSTPLKRKPESISNSIWFKLTKIKVEGFPGLLKMVEIRKKNKKPISFSFLFTSDENQDYLDYLNKSYTQLTRGAVDEIFEIIMENSMFQGVLEDRTKVYFIDTQIFYYLYTINVKKTNSYFTGEFLNLIIPHL